jgi:DNA-binding GntR family transcriptional regulator
MAGSILKERVYEAVREKIVNGAIHPGAGLNEVALANELNVSRTPVREAIRQLAAEGFADYKPHCGGSVLTPSPELVREVFQIREALEGIAAREAALRMDAEELRAIRADFERIRAAIASGDLSDVGDAIHEKIFAASGNLRLENLMSIYRGQVAWLQKIASRVTGRLEHAFREHESILSALESRAPEWAESVARTHVRNTYLDLTNSLGAAAT